MGGRPLGGFVPLSFVIVPSGAAVVTVGALPYSLNVERAPCERRGLGNLGLNQTSAYRHKPPIGASIGNAASVRVRPSLEHNGPLGSDLDLDESGQNAGLERDHAVKDFSLALGQSLVWQSGGIAWHGITSG